MSTATNPMGLKRICTNCGERFYDLNKRPITCPECETEFTGEIKPKTRRGRAPAVEVKVEEKVKKDEGEIQVEDAGIEVISLDDAEPSKDTSTEEEDSSVLGEDTLDDIADVTDAESELGDEDILLDNEDDK